MDNRSVCASCLSADFSRKYRFLEVGDLQSGFYVADDGEGIPAEDRETVFEAGYTTAETEGGTGVGLTLVQELAETCDWTCTVTESRAGEARFEFGDVTFASDA